jgi:hypothetical protein
VSYFKRVTGGYLHRNTSDRNTSERQETMSDNIEYVFDHPETKHELGTMDINVQKKTYSGFLQATKYLVIVSVAALVLLAYLTL